MNHEQEYDRLNFWVQGWLAKLNSTISFRNMTSSGRLRKVFDRDIANLRPRYEKAVERRKPAADALMKKLEAKPPATANS